MASPSSTVCIPVTANGFTDIVSMQYSMNWDPTILTFSGVNIPNPTNLAGLTNANFSSPSAGNLGLAWADPDATGKTVADGTLLYEVCFTVANNATVGSTATISFSDSPVVSEIFNASGQNLPFNSNPATLTVDNVVDPSACLLYTSPSPRDRTRSRMPSSA